MAMPVVLVLVRHGEAEGNVARRSSVAGDNSVFTEQFCNRHHSRLRLTDRGREQARVAGAWLKQHIGEQFDRYLVSGYLRAMETAALLDLPGARWYQDFYLRERDMGPLEIMSESDKKQKHPEAYRQYELDPFYWTPPNGESIAQLCLRIDRVLHTLHRECSEKRVVIVTHGMVMWAFIMRTKRLTPRQSAPDLRPDSESQYPRENSLFLPDCSRIAPGSRMVPESFPIKTIPDHGG